MTADAFLRGFLRGDSAAWPWPSSDEEAGQRFLREAGSHHVEALIAWKLNGEASASTWPATIRSTLAQCLRREAVREAIVQREVSAVFEALGKAQIPAVAMKGTALAYTVYPEPVVRRRNDTDLMIRQQDRQRIVPVLADLGFELLNDLAGERVGHQAQFRRTDRHGIVHDLDVHWKVSNRPLFEDMFTWPEFFAAAVPVPALGSHARALGLPHALALACLHPVAHHGNAPEGRLRWSFDVHLLTARMTTADFTAWLELLESRRIRTIGRHGLESARERFGTAVPGWVMDRLSGDVDEPSAAYLSAGPWRGDVRLSDFRTTPGLRAKMQLVREVVVPSETYMREAYGLSPRTWVAPFYAYRVVRGSWRLFMRLAEGGRG